MDSPEWESSEDQKLQINPETGMSSDYFNDLNCVALFLNIKKARLADVVYGLSQDSHWRIITYTEYIAEKDWKSQKNLQNKLALKRISLVDEHVRILNEEINKCKNSHIDEERFKKSFNAIYFIIFWNAKLAI